MIRRADMQYEKKAEFVPVTITFETQDELDLLFAILSRTASGAGNNFAYKLWKSVQRDATPGASDMLVGKLDINKYYEGN